MVLLFSSPLYSVVYSICQSSVRCLHSVSSINLPRWVTFFTHWLSSKGGQNKIHKNKIRLDPRERSLRSLFTLSSSNKSETRWIRTSRKQNGKPRTQLLPRQAKNFLLIYARNYIMFSPKICGRLIYKKKVFDTYVQCTSCTYCQTYCISSGKVAITFKSWQQMTMKMHKRRYFPFQKVSRISS